MGDETLSMQDAGRVVALVSTFISGFAMQWLRQYPWFRDDLVFAVALVGGVICAWLLEPATRVEAALAVMQNTLTILGGVFAGHAASYKVNGIPRYNDRGK